jgi:serine/threonine-protein kinase RsbW
MSSSTRSSGAQPTGEPHAGVLVVVNSAEAIEAAQQHVAKAAEQLAYPKASVFALKLAMHEAIVNAFKHGHKELPASTPVRVRYAVEALHVELEIEDQGPGFDPQAVPDPTLEENIERGSGRGLLLIRAYMSRVEYNAKGNRLLMVYRKPDGK